MARDQESYTFILLEAGTLQQRTAESETGQAAQTAEEPAERRHSVDHGNSRWHGRTGRQPLCR